MALAFIEKNNSKRIKRFEKKKSHKIKLFNQFGKEFIRWDNEDHYIYHGATIRTPEHEDRCRSTEWSNAKKRSKNKTANMPLWFTRVKMVKNLRKQYRGRNDIALTRKEYAFHERSHPDNKNNIKQYSFLEYCDESIADELFWRDDYDIDYDEFYGDDDFGDFDDCDDDFGDFDDCNDGLYDYYPEWWDYL